MSAILIDTNVLSELVRPAPDRRVVAWSQRLARFHLSVITLEEIEFGLSSKPNARVAQLLESIIADYAEVLPVTEAIARRAGQLRGQFRREGSSRTAADMLIAATALEHHAQLATRNARDFQGCGLQVINPFAK